jgi:hypothetical protein
VVKGNRKGSLTDLSFIMTVLLSAALIIMIGFVVMSNLNDKFQASDIVTSDGKAASTTLTNYYPSIIDNSFLLLTVGLAIATLVFALFVRIHPIFIPLFFIGLAIVVFLSGITSNIFQEMAAHPDMVTYADQLLFISTIMGLLPFIIAAFGILLMIIMYKMWRVNQ